MGQLTAESPGQNSSCSSMKLSQSTRSSANTTQSAQKESFSPSSRKPKSLDKDEYSDDDTELDETQIEPRSDVLDGDGEGDDSMEEGQPPPDQDEYSDDDETQLGLTATAGESASNLRDDLRRRNRDFLQVTKNMEDPLEEATRSEPVKNQYSANDDVQQRKRTKLSKMDPKPSAKQIEDSFDENSNQNSQSNDEDTIDNDENDHLSLPKSKPRKIMRLQKPVPKMTAAQKRPKGKMRQPWSDAEEQMLVDGVKEYGVGKWACIKQQLFLNSSRTQVNLKDKWRNIAHLYAE